MYIYSAHAIAVMIWVPEALRAPTAKRNVAVKTAGRHHAASRPSPKRVSPDAACLPEAAGHADTLMPTARNAARALRIQKAR